MGGVLDPLPWRLRTLMQCLLGFEVLAVAFLTFVNALVASVQEDLFHEPLLGPMATVLAGALIALALVLALRAAGRGAVSGHAAAIVAQRVAIVASVLMQPLVAWGVVTSLVLPGAVFGLAVTAFLSGGLVRLMLARSRGLGG